MKKLSELQDFFYDKIYPDLEFLEQKRLKIYNYLKKVAIVLFLITIFIVLLLQDYIFYSIEILLVIVMAPLGIFMFIYKIEMSGFSSVYKDELIEKLVLFVDENLKYSKNHFIREHEYRASSLFPQQVDRFGGDDFVSGVIDNVNMKFSEIHSEVKKKTNKGKTHWQTIFRGLMFIADFNKDFKGKTVVIPDNSEKFLGSISHFFQSFSSRGELVKMDNSEFEREFTIYSDNQIEARYILSHALMQSILEYKKLVGKNLYISFTRSQIYIAIGFNKKLFEPKIYKKITSFDEVSLYFKVISLTVNIVKHLNLDRRIWTKR